jgi:hypothetical protein
MSGVGGRSGSDRIAGMSAMKEANIAVAQISVTVPPEVEEN